MKENEIQQLEVRADKEIYNIPRLKKIFGPGPHSIVGHDVGLHWGAPGWENMTADHVLEAMKNIYHQCKNTEDHKLYEEFSKHFVKEGDNNYRYLYEEDNRNIGLEILEIPLEGLIHLRKIIQDIIFSFFAEKSYFKLGFVPNLTQCEEELKEWFKQSDKKFSHIYNFLLQKIQNVKEMDIEKNDYSAILIYLSAISCHAYDEINKRRDKLYNHSNHDD